MKAKHMVMGFIMALQLVSGFTYTVDASWLSKTWERLETKAAKESYDWPKAEQYRYYSIGQYVGERLPQEELMVFGIPLGSTFDTVKASLGQPTKETRYGLSYGGVTFGNTILGGMDSTVTYISITNRDAITHRGIAVGDSMRKVLKVYGRPNYIDYDNRWFYGLLQYRTDMMNGILFEHKGDKVSKIIIYL